MEEPKTVKEFQYLWRNRCRAHGHRYLSHMNCYRIEKEIPEKIGFLDIEASNLKANFGIVFSYCIKPLGSKNILHTAITREDVTKDLDKKVITQCIKDMRKFDRLVGYYSRDYRYDIPFLRTRAEYWDLDFPRYGEIIFDDAYDMVKSKLCLSSNRLNVACEALFGETLKTRIEAMYWVRALAGNKKALAYIVDHNKKDVIDLERVYTRLRKYCRRSSRSI